MGPRRHNQPLGPGARPSQGAHPDPGARPGPGARLDAGCPT